MDATSTPSINKKHAFERGVAHAADMFALIRHIVACGNGPGLHSHADMRICNFKVDYPSGQINVGAAFIGTLIENPELIEGFGAVLTGVLGVIEQHRTVHNLVEEADLTYEQWIYKRPEGEGANSIEPSALPREPSDAAAEPA